MLILDSLRSNAAVTLVSAAVIYVITVALYRLYFSPLTKFPGPKLAAVTSLYEFYYDIACEGTFFKKIQDLHTQYGPIVRISPRELHIADSKFYENFFASKLDKDPALYDMLNLPLSSIGTVEHELHRTRRAALNPFFSRSNINAQVPIVQEKANLLVEQLLASADLDQPVRLDISFEALTIDVITQCAFGESYNSIENMQLAFETNETFVLAQRSNHINRFLPPVRRLLSAIPSGFLLLLVPRLKGVVDLQTSIRVRVQEIMKNKDSYIEFKSDKIAKPTVYHQLLTSDLPPEELTEKRLTDEGAIVVTAGFTTTARALTAMAFHLITKPDILEALRKEIRPVVDQKAPDLPTYSELEPLPLLTAVIKEGIRLSWGVSSRLPRISRTPVQYQNQVIPAGTVISMNNNDVLMDPEIFPEPEKFMPERWLAGDGKNQSLDRFFVPFGKGPRSCVGLWLAYAEMYIATTALFSRFDFELFETDERTIAPVRDYFTPHPDIGFYPFKVLVKSASAQA